MTLKKLASIKKVMDKIKEFKEKEILEFANTNMKKN